MLSRLKRDHKYSVCCFFTMDMMYVCVYTCLIIFNNKMAFLIIN